MNRPAVGYPRSDPGDRPAPYEEERVSVPPHGVAPSDLKEEDLLRELNHLHVTRHGTFLHASDDALGMHTRRTAELEAEYVRRHPERQVDPARLRSGARDRP